MEYARTRLDPRQSFRPQEGVWPRPADPLVSLQYRVGTIRSPGEGFVDGPYIFRPVGETISTRAAYCGYRTKSSLTTPSRPTRDEGFGDGRGDLPSWVEACRLIMERGPLITQPATQFVRIPGRVRPSLISARGQIDISVPGLELSLDSFRILAKPYPISIVHSGGWQDGTLQGIYQEL